MPKFTIETSYRIPVYRQRVYHAETLADACRLSVEDDDWEGSKEDYETAGETYVSGAWPGEVAAYSVPPLSVPSQFGETVQRKTDHFEVLLGLLKLFAHAPGAAPPDAPFWRDRLDAAILKAEAIIASQPDPEAGAAP